MVDLADPSKPLKNRRHELFSIQKSKGVDNGAAWKNTIPFGQAYSGGPTSLRVSGHRVARRNEVRARIKWLIAAARNDAGDVPETFERSDIIKLSLEVSDALEAAYQGAVKSNISPLRLEQLRTVFASHLGRQGKLAEGADEILPDDDAAEQVKKMILWMENREPCTCPTH